MSARTFTLRPSRPIDPDLAEEMEKQSPWVSARVRDVRVVDAGSAVTFAVDDDADSEVERASVARFVHDMTARHRPIDRRVLVRRSRGRAPAGGDAYAELLRRGWVVERGRGRVSLRGPALAVVRALDEDCARIAHSTYGAIEESHAALAPTQVLARCGWFASFPHAASLVARLAEDYDAIDRFREANTGARDLVQPRVEAVAPFEACLLPALCYAVFAAREGTRLAAESAAITCAGRCFRYESRNLSGLERLWEFGMREIVFLGPDAFAIEARTSALATLLDQIERWDLDGWLETASDPFFAPVRAGRAFWQRSGDRKIELRLAVASSDGDAPRSIACASVNLHDRFFGSTFEIVAGDGAPIASACVGWGMERWALACFTQHGFDPAQWPGWLRGPVFG